MTTPADGAVPSVGAFFREVCRCFTEKYGQRKKRDSSVCWIAFCCTVRYNPVWDFEKRRFGMKKETLNLYNDLNRAIIKCRGIYSAWSAAHSISYHEMLVIYTIREFGFCTQKQICDSYLLPRQTMNNVIRGMRENGLLTYSAAHSFGREKAFVLSDKGEEHVAPLLASLDAMESGTLELLGSEKMAMLTQLLFEYDSALAAVMKETKRE